MVEGIFSATWFAVNCWAMAIQKCGVGRAPRPPDEGVRAYVFISSFSTPQDCLLADSPATLEMTSLKLDIYSQNRNRRRSRT